MPSTTLTTSDLVPSAIHTFLSLINTTTPLRRVSARNLASCHPTMDPAPCRQSVEAMRRHLRLDHASREQYLSMARHATWTQHENTEQGFAIIHSPTDSVISATAFSMARTEPQTQSLATDYIPNDGLMQLSKSVMRLHRPGQRFLAQIESRQAGSRVLPSIKHAGKTTTTRDGYNRHPSHARSRFNLIHRTHPFSATATAIARSSLDL
jgi:hypothetical protein